jgi:hypothetical protein
MALTIQTSPPSWGAVYRPLEFEVSSDINPSTHPYDNVNIISVRKANNSDQSLGAQSDDVVVVHAFSPLFPTKQHIEIVDLTDELYKGVYRVKRKLSNTKCVIDTSYNGDDYGGTINKYYNRFGIICRVYLGTAATGTPLAKFKVDVKDSSDNYHFDVSGLLQKELGPYFATSPPIQGQDGGDVYTNYICTFTEEYDFLLNDGTYPLTETTGNKVTSSVFTAVNSAPQFVMMRNQVHESDIRDDLASFVVDLVDTDARFLTNAPQAIDVWQDFDTGNESPFQLQVCMEGGLAAGTYDMYVIAYNAAGGVVAFNGMGFTKPTTDSVITFNAGPAGFTLTEVPATTRYYTIQLRKDASAISELRRFNIFSDCKPGEKLFHWENVYGGIDTYLFRGAESQQLKHKRSLVQSKLSATHSDLQEAEVSVSEVSSEELFTSNTSIQSLEYREWLTGILKSPRVWVSIKRSSEFGTTSKIPVVIKDGNVNVWNSQKSTGNFSFKWRFAHEQISQRA